MHFYLTQIYLIDRGLLIFMHFVVPLTEFLDSTFYTIKVNKLQKTEQPIDFISGILKIFVVS